MLGDGRRCGGATLKHRKEVVPIITLYYHHERERTGGSWLLEEAGPEGIANHFEERVSRNCDMQYVLMEADI